MMKIFTRLTAVLASLCTFAPALQAQPGIPPQTQTQQLALAGLRSVAQQGQINAVKTDASGNLYLLLNQGDGVRLLKTDNNASNILAQTLLGATGDVGLALALDPSGNLYVAGTSTSTSLVATSGAAIPTRIDASTQSFVAKFDPSLNSLFVTFTGGSKIVAAALAATSDAVFVTGTLYAANLPVTNSGIQQSPALGSSQNGFVEKFSASGSTLLYATYLTGALGDTTPTAIIADPADDAYIAGATTASGFPTIAALVPATLSNPSGFLTKLTPAGDGITFSTFIPGPGLTSIALDPTGQTLLLSGSVALGQFPVDTVVTPLVPTTYQVLLRMPLDGSAVQSSTLIAPGTQSFLTPSANGSVWIDGTLTAPLLPITPLSDIGSAFAARVTSSNTIDQTARFGGLPTTNPSFASLPTTLTSIAVDSSGEPLIAGFVQPTASASLLATETYDLPLFNTPTPALPSTLQSSKQTAATCTGSLCSGSAAYLAKLNPNASAPSLALSSDDLPFVTLRNLGSTAATNLQITVSGPSFTSNCPYTLPSAAECNLLLAAGSAGTLTVSAGNAAAQTASFPALSTPTSTIVFSPRELDFGIQTSTSPAGQRTLTVTNLGSNAQTFTSAIASSSRTASPFTEASSDCPVAGALTVKTLPSNASCHITLAFTAASSPAGDGFLQADWFIGARAAALTAYSQAAALSLSAPEIDFGTQYANGLRLPRFLYLSNNSTQSLTHTPVSLPTGSPFTLTDACPTTLLPSTVCRLRIDYLSPTIPSTDSTTLALDLGMAVLLTGQTLPQPTANGTSVNPNLTLTPASLNFANAVLVTGVSSNTQTVTVTNSGASSFPLTLALTGDFTQVNGCGSSLAGGQSCTILITFTPSQPGARQGLLAVTAGSGTTPAYVALSGIGTPILQPNNGALTFPSIPIGQPAAQFYKVTQPFSSLTLNTTGPYTAALIEDTGYGHGQPPTSAYAASDTGTCRNCFLAIQFLPTAAGLQSGTVSLASSAAGVPYTLNLTGSGLPTTGLLLTPALQDFGSVPLHSSSGSFLFTLTNLSAAAAPITLTAPALTGDFTLNPTRTGAQPCGGTLAYTASCQLELLFAPTALGTRTGSLTLSAGSASASATLTGTASADSGIALNPLALTFSNVPGTSANQQTVTLTNTGAATVQVGTPTAASANFAASTSCAALASAASCTLTVNFLPAVAIVADILSIPITQLSPTGTPLTSTYTVALTGAFTTADAGLEIVPGASAFGPIPVGTQASTRQFTINNLTAKALTLNLSIPRQFVLVGAPCAALAPNASCTFSAAFLPLTNADITGTLFAQANPTDGSATLNGIGYVEGYGLGHGALTLSGALIVNGLFNFGQVASGQPTSQTFTLTNANAAGSPAITVRRVTSSPPFLATTTCGAALAVGQSCPVTVTYTPINQVLSGAAAASTTDAGVLTLESDAASSPNLINLAGQAGPVVVASPANITPLATFTLSQSSLTFPTTAVGNVSAPQTITLANTGTVAIHVASVTAPPDYTVQSTCAIIVPGASCAATVTASPHSTGSHIGSLNFLSDSSTALEFVSLLSAGTPSPLTLSTSALDFGSVSVGASAILPVQIANTTANPIFFTSITATGDYATTGTCPAAGASLAANASCTLQVTFTPAATGVRTGTLLVATSASTNPLTVALTGTGTQSRLLITPAALAFGSIVLAAPANLTLTLANTGSANISSLALATSGDYAITVPCATTVLIPGASCSVQVTFTPAALGARSGTLTITSSDPSSPVSVPLTGTGIQGGSFSLTVNGAASASASVKSGQPATYTLTITPLNGFAGSVALTCAAVTPAQYASCSIAPASVTLAGTQSATVTLNTITSVTTGKLRPLTSSASKTAFACLLLPGLLSLCVGRRRRTLLKLSVLVLASTVFAQLGCGGGGDPNARYTPAGTFQYQVTASSTSGIPITQTVTLNLTVTPR